MEKGYHIKMLSITIMAAANQTRARQFYLLDINAQTKNENQLTLVSIPACSVLELDFRN